MAARGSAGNRWSVLLWLVPVISIADVLWAITAKAGVAITFGLGLSKWEMIHVIIQVALIVALSLYFVASSPSGDERPAESRDSPSEEPVVVEEADAAVQDRDPGE